MEENMTNNVTEELVDTAADTTMEAITKESFWSKHPNLNALKVGALAGIGSLAAMGSVYIATKVPGWVRAIKEKRAEKKAKKASVPNEEVDNLE